MRAGLCRLTSRSDKRQDYTDKDVFCRSGDFYPEIRWVVGCLDLLQIGDFDEIIDSDKSELCCLGVQTGNASEDS